MSKKHKKSTICFWISDRERQQFEVNVLCSGLSKQNYFIRSCINARLCVVGKKETVYQIVEEMKAMLLELKDMQKQLESETLIFDLEDMQTAYEYYMDMLNAIIRLLDGAAYLWNE